MCFTVLSLALGVNTLLTILTYLKGDLPQGSFHLCFFNNQKKHGGIFCSTFVFPILFVVTFFKKKKRREYLKTGQMDGNPLGIPALCS